MIAYLNGNLTYKTPTHVYVECQGVGYLVQISLQTFQKIETLERVKLFTYVHINENAHTLYGFSNEDEKELFIHLISVSGVGPNSARLILSYLSNEEVSNAIISGNQSLLQSIKGIGQKTAQRIIIDLRDKIQKDKKTDVLTGVSQTQTPPVKEEAIAALQMLGFQRAQIEKVVQKMLISHGNQLSVEELIKQSLKNL
ncbi:MAG: Holliday junction branch migration protein RuvA [Chitinophagales bacterium]|nr:Holliday junction branch migration protein RuvA [Chitinophagales bacterium]